MDAVKNEFLTKTNVRNENDALRNCIGASFKRNKIYRNGWNNTSRLQKDELHFSLKVELQRLAEPYISGTVSEDEHEINIQNLADNISKEAWRNPSERQVQYRNEPESPQSLPEIFMVSRSVIY